MITKTLKKEITLESWTIYQGISSDIKQVFNEALNGFVGVIYIPNEVAIESVDKTDYRFKCYAYLPHSDIFWEAIVEIHKSLGVKSHITNITKL